MIKDDKHILGPLLIIISSLLISTGQLLWKISYNAASNNFLLVIIGLLMYGFGAIIMIQALRFNDLSKLYPIMAIGYVFAFFYSTFLLNESYTKFQLIGVTLIIAGSIGLSKD